MKRISVSLRKYSALAGAIFYKKRLLNIFSVFFSYILKRKKVWGEPFFVQVEPTNRCLLNCNLCVTGLDKLRRAKRDMSFQEFVQIINQFEDSMVYLVLYNLGEPLLNSQIYQMVEYAKKKRVFVKLSTSGYFKNKEHIKNIVSCGIDELIISLDCVSAQVYSRLKNSLGFDGVIENIKLIIEERKGKHKPFISIQLLLTRDNEEEISRFEFFVRSLKADGALIKKIRVDFPGSPPETSLLPRNTRYIRRCYRGGYKRSRCYRPWISTVILSDNSVVPCCFDMHGEYNFGNISNLNFSQIWNNPEYASFRAKITGNIKEAPLCKQCSAQDFFDNFLN